MLQETKFIIENLSRPLIDIDVNQSNSWVGITGYLETIGRDIHKIPIGTYIHFNDKSYNLSEELRVPMVRIINDSLALVFGTRKQYDKSNKINSWILNSSGQIEEYFFVDLAVEDILVTNDYIVFTGFDEGPGLDVYDHKGKFLFTYEEIFGKDVVDIFDCYAAALVTENKIIFCPYTEFPIVIFDIENKTQQILEIPKAARGFHAITKRGNKFYFHRVYELELEDYDFGVYEWQIGSEEVRKVGEYQNHFTRGLPGGKFLAKNESGYAIISVL